MTIKPQTLWIVVESRHGYEAQRVIIGRDLILVCDDILAGSDLDDLRARLPRGLHVDTRFPFSDPNIVEAWAA